MKRRTFFTFAVILLISFLLVTQQACEKDDNPNQSPVCEITAPVNGQEITKGDTVTVSVNATDDDGSIVEVRFFIDGIGKSSVSSFPFNYQWHTDTESTGNHTVKATSIDNDGGSSSDEVSLIIIEGGNPGPPIADFTASVTSGSAPLTINFTDQSVNNPTKWIWGFSDGGTNDQQNPTYTFNNDGSYTVTLTVSNEYGSDTKTKINYIFVGSSTFSDPRDGQPYHTVVIGNQTWFAENLKYLPSVSPSSDGANFSSFYYYVYGYEGTNVAEAKATTNFQTYGVLYNWLAATNACPDGWHLPTDNEWKTLEMYLGMSQSEADDYGWRGYSFDVGKKLKSTSGWYNNGNGTDELGFSALPGGWRTHLPDTSGFFMGVRRYGAWWSSTSFYNARAKNRSLYYERNEINRDGDYKGKGLSVRCIKD